jgi:hypothetical protein
MVALIGETQGHLLSVPNAISIINVSGVRIRRQKLSFITQVPDIAVKLNEISGCDAHQSELEILWGHPT